MRYQHEIYPPNTKAVQRLRKVLKHRMSIEKKSRRTAPVRPNVNEDVKKAQRALMEKEKVVPVVSRPRVKKKSFFNRLGNAIIGNNTGSVGEYVIWEVLVPAAKNLIQEMISSGVDMMLFGESSNRARSRRDDRTVISYSGYYRGRDRDRERSSREYLRVPSHHNRLDGIVFGDRADAEEVLDNLSDMLRTFEYVSIADFYELCDLSSISQWTDNAWGWDNLSKAAVVMTKNGYEIDFPNPIKLN